MTAHPPNPKVEVVCYSASGNTLKLAKLIAKSSGGRVWALPQDGKGKPEMWEALDAADAILFGSPTYMGGPAWQFKRFADMTSDRWSSRDWLNKLAGGFTTSTSTNGDKDACLSYFMTLANQHGMLWVSLGQPSPPSNRSSNAEMNWTGASAGVMAIAGRGGMAEGDEASAEAFGARVREIALRFLA